MTAAVRPVETPDQVLEFTLGDERYCVDMEAVDKLVGPTEIPEIPDSPSPRVGTMELRGRPTAVVNLKAVLGLPDPAVGGQVVVFDGPRSKRHAWPVDWVHGITDLSDPQVDTGAEKRYVNGYVSDGERTVTWVEPDAVSDSCFQL